MQYIKQLNELSGLPDADENSLHHEFSDATTNKDIVSHQNPFDFSMTKNVTNIPIGESLENVMVKYLLNLIHERETLYKHFAEKRFMKHSKALFDTLTKGNENDPNGLGNKPRDVEQIMSKLSNIQILQ